MGNLVCQLQVFPTQFSIFAPLLWNLLCRELPGDGKAPQVFSSSLATSNILNLSHSTGYVLQMWCSVSLIKHRFLKLEKTGDRKDESRLLLTFYLTGYVTLGFTL